MLHTTSWSIEFEKFVLFVWSRATILKQNILPPNYMSPKNKLSLMTSSDFDYAIGEYEDVKPN